MLPSHPTGRWRIDRSINQSTGTAAARVACRMSRERPPPHTPPLKICADELLMKLREQRVAVSSVLHVSLIQQLLQVVKAFQLSQLKGPHTCDLSLRSRTGPCEDCRLCCTQCCPACFSVHQLQCDCGAASVLCHCSGKCPKLGVQGPAGGTGKESGSV